jgi:hypothetical protein
MTIGLSRDRWSWWVLLSWSQCYNLNAAFLDIQRVGTTASSWPHTFSGNFGRTLQNVTCLAVNGYRYWGTRVTDNVWMFVILSLYMPVLMFSQVMQSCIRDFEWLHIKLHQNWRSDKSLTHHSWPFVLRTWCGPVTYDVPGCGKCKSAGGHITTTNRYLTIPLFFLQTWGGNDSEACVAEHLVEPFVLLLCFPCIFPLG